MDDTTHASSVPRERTKTFRFLHFKTNQIVFLVTSLECHRFREAATDRIVPRVRGVIAFLISPALHVRKTHLKIRSATSTALLVLEGPSLLQEVLSARVGTT